MPDVLTPQQTPANPVASSTPPPAPLSAQPTAAQPNIVALRALASQAMEGDAHRREHVLEDLVGAGSVAAGTEDPATKGKAGDLSILLARQRMLAESAMEGEDRKKAREAEEAIAKAAAEAAQRKKDEATRLTKIKADERAELQHIAEEARTKQHNVLESQKTTVDELVHAPAMSIRPVRTFKEDMNAAIKGNNLSLVSIAIKEDEKRRREEEVVVGETKQSHWFAIVSTLLILAGLGIGGYAVYVTYFTTTEETAAPTSPNYTSLVFAEKTKVVPTNTLNDTQLVSLLKNEVRNLNASLGTIEDVHFVDTKTNPESISLQRFISILQVRLPDSLLRNVQAPFMYGVHSASENAGFLVVKPDNYDRTFAGLLEWEPTLVRDLYVILTGVTPESALLQARFSDVLLKNVNSRVVRDANGKIVLLYAFFDKDTLLITANEATFVELLTRLTTPRPTLQR